MNEEMINFIDVRHIEALLKQWQEDLDRYIWTPQVCDGMDASSAIGVQHGRIVCLKMCIKQLKDCLDQKKTKI